MLSAVCEPKSALSSLNYICQSIITAIGRVASTHPKCSSTVIQPPAPGGYLPICHSPNTHIQLQDISHSSYQLAEALCLLPVLFCFASVCSRNPNPSGLGGGLNAKRQSSTFPPWSLFCLLQGSGVGYPPEYIFALAHCGHPLETQALLSKCRLSSSSLAHQDTQRRILFKVHQR